MLSSNWKCYNGNIEIIYFFLSPILGELQPNIGLFTSNANTGKNWCEHFDVKTPNNFTGVGKIIIVYELLRDNFLMIMDSSPEALRHWLLSKKSFWSGIIKPSFVILFASQCLVPQEQTCDANGSKKKCHRKC